MKNLLFAGILMAVAAGVVCAEEGRYQIFQGAVPGETGKGASPVSVVLKIDTGSGDTWRLLVTSGGYWWIPVKTGMIKSRGTEDKSEEETAPAVSE